MQFSKLLALVCCCMGLTACYMSTTYERIEAPGAVYFKDICRGTVGPPSTVYYPFHGIYISLNYSFATFGLHIPEGMTVQLMDNAISVNGYAKSGPVQATIHFKAFPRGATGNDDPLEFAVYPPFTSSDTLGPFEGRSAGGHYVYYAFMGADEIRPNRMVSPPFGLTEGTIELPAMIINGQQYGPQTLPFKQAKHSEISPINC
jgi:hypothetical protein